LKRQVAVVVVVSRLCGEAEVDAGVWPWRGNFQFTTRKTQRDKNQLNKSEYPLLFSSFTSIPNTISTSSLPSLVTAAHETNPHPEIQGSLQITFLLAQERNTQLGRSLYTTPELNP
jgi:hypothetical protein